MKLHYLEYDIQALDGAAAPPALAALSAMTLLLTHPAGMSHLFYIYPSGAGWNDPAVWSPEILRLLQESRTVEASSLYHLLKTIVRMNLKRLLGDRQ
jgi:hypothetical protein